MTPKELRAAVARVRAAVRLPVRLPLFDGDELRSVAGSDVELSADDQLKVLSEAWLETACVAREAQRHIPGGFPLERAVQLRELDEMADFVIVDMPDLEMLRLGEADDDVGLLEHLQNREAARDETKFIRARALNARKELWQQGDPLDEPVTRNTVGRILTGVLTALQESGNDILAHKYRSAFDRVQAAVTNLEAFNATGAVANGMVDEATIAESELLVQAVDVAEDEFETVAADVGAWLERHDVAEAE